MNNGEASLIWAPHDCDSVIRTRRTAHARLEDVVSEHMMMHDPHRALLVRLLVETVAWLL